MHCVPRRSQTSFKASESIIHFTSLRVVLGNEKTQGKVPWVSQD